MASEVAETTRRTFLGQVIAACVAFLAALIGIPAAGAIVGPAFNRTPPSWTPLGRAEDFPVDVPTTAEFPITRKDGWIETTDTRGVGRPHRAHRLRRLQRPLHPPGLRLPLESRHEPVRLPVPRRRLQQGWAGP